MALGVATAILLPLETFDVALLRVIETASLDLRFRARGIKPPHDEVVLVLVDDRSLAALGRWPLSRHFLAQAIRTIGHAGAKVTVLDLLFPESEETIPNTARDLMRAAAARLTDPQDASLRVALDRLTEDSADADLAAAERSSGKLLLPLTFSFSGIEANPPPLVSAQAYQRLEPSPAEPVFPLQARSVVTPVAVISDAAEGLGHVNTAFDRDGAPRYDYLALPFSGDFFPSLAVRTVAEFQGTPWAQVGLALGGGVRIGPLWIPTDRAMRLVVNYRGPRGTIPTYSFIDLVEGRIPADKLVGRIVLIGASFLGITDANASPFNNTPMPGTERLATIIDSLLAGDFIQENPPPWPVITIGMILLLAALIGIATARLPTRFVGLAGVILIVVWAAVAQTAFNHGLWLPVINPILALTGAALGTLLFRYGFVELHQRRLQAAFRHYLAPELVDQLTADPGRLRLGGDTRTISVMFCDLRGFTAISEQFKSNPEGLGRLINRGFLTPMTRLIITRHGTIDKYIGDCIMAFWGAPLTDDRHADHACACALAMMRELDGINDQGQQESESDDRDLQRLHIGIGINTGECVVGNMGSDEHFAYTAMGDAVNLAARLEGQTKVYGVPVIIGEATRDAAPAWATLEIDLVAIRGRQQAARIYALVGDEELAGSADFIAHVSRHERLLSAYRRQDWATARLALVECQKWCELRALYELYNQRIAYFEDSPPGLDWNGVFVSENK